MKKLLVILLSVFTIGTLSAQSSKERPITFNDLPENSQFFINHHFPEAKVSLAKMEKEFRSVNYDVVLSDGVKIEFGKNGEWTEVDCEYAAVPQSIIPLQIQERAKQISPDSEIVKIDRDSKNIEVKLSNGWDLKFDLKYNLLNIDKD